MSRRPHTLMGLALVATGVMQAIKAAAEGEDVLTAAADAIEDTRVRGRAIKKAGREASKEISRRRGTKP